MNILFKIWNLRYKPTQNIQMMRMRMGSNHGTVVKKMNRIKTLMKQNIDINVFQFDLNSNTEVFLEDSEDDMQNISTRISKIVE